MPHVFLEVTRNVQLPEDYHEFLVELNQSLAECATFEIARIKSRLQILDNYCTADGEADKGFVYLRLNIIPGRNESLKLRIQEHMLAFLQHKLVALNPSIHVHFSVHLVDLNEYTFVVKAVES